MLFEAETRRRHVDRERESESKNIIADKVFNENSLLKSFLPLTMWTKVSLLMENRCILANNECFIYSMNGYKNFFFFILNKFLILFDHPKINK